MNVWTDGAYSSLSQMGGWAWASSLSVYGSGRATDTTNNRMELTAVVEALLFFYRADVPINIISDSQYVVSTMNEKWYLNWARNNWMKSTSGQRTRMPVPNADLWMRVIKGVSLHEPGVTFEWVRGHSGDRMNDFVDQLAVSERLRK